jgi:phosphoenolpyruvate carboxylase
MPDKDKPLRQNIRLLGNLLGEVITEQQGEGFFELEESIRALTKRLRKRMRPALQRRLQRLISGLDADTLGWIVRAFTVYFQLVNTAEQHHRIQRLRAYRQGPRPLPPPGSLEATLRSLKKQNVSASRLHQFFDQLRILPVFTAHPTEATRRTILEKHSRIWHVLEQFDRGDLLPQERMRCEDEIKRQITSLWQTEETRSYQISVLDELWNGLYYFEHVLSYAVPEFYRDLERAVEITYPTWNSRIPSFLRFGSWIGGDRDGNPNVTAEITWKALRRSSRLILDIYLKRLEDLFVERSESARLVGVSEKLRRSVQEDRQLLAHLPAVVNIRNPEEVYRAKISQIYRKLQLRRSLLDGEEIDPLSRLYSASEFLEELYLMDESLRSHRGETIADGKLKDLIRLVETFGFHLSTLDIRQHSSRHAAAVAEVAQQIGFNYSERSVQEQQSWLTSQLLPTSPPEYNEKSLSPDSREVFDTLKVIQRSLTEIDPQSIRSYIISMTSSAKDVLEVLFLMKTMGLLDSTPDRQTSRIDIVPLFETIEDLHRAPHIMEELYTNPAYKLHLAARGWQQEIMIGYSDSSKDGGIVMSHAKLQETQLALAKVSQRHSVSWMFFHGRGGTVGRGGGPEYQAILALPRGTTNNRIKITEQGEVISLKYAHPAIAQRTFELSTSAMMVQGLLNSKNTTERSEEKQWIRAFQCISEGAYRRYREVIYGRKEFVSYFLQATPLREIARLNIGSRPAKRVESERIEDLRAIPWVFAWMQSRHVLPGWFGLGAGMRHFLHNGREIAHTRNQRIALLRKMYRRWPAFKALIDNIQMTMAKADFDIAAQYATLVSPPELGSSTYELLRRDFEETRELILLVTQQQHILDHNPTLQKSIQLRNPYVDPMSYIQVELLRRLRSSSSEQERQRVEAAVLLSINGIAAGLRNTG